MPTDKQTIEQSVKVSPQCEGEGFYADGLDDAACSTECTLCGSNGWIVDLSALTTAEQEQEAQPMAYVNSKHLSRLDAYEIVPTQLYKSGGDSFTPLYASPTISEGWQLVPIEPTVAMVIDGSRQTTFCVEVYRTMLAAAPKDPIGTYGGSE